MIRRKQNGKRTESTDHCTQLLLEAQKGDSQAFGELYAELNPVVRNFIASFNGQLCPHEREDIVHDTFLAIWEKRTSYRGEASAKTFILAIAKNLMLRHIDNRRQKLPMVYAGDLNDVLTEEELCKSPDSWSTGSSEILTRIQQAMAHLTDVQRQSIELDVIRGLPRQESLKLANCNPNQFQKRLQRGMEALCHLLRHLRCIIL